MPAPKIIITIPPIAVILEIRSGLVASQALAAPADKPQMLSEIKAIIQKIKPKMSS